MHSRQQQQPVTAKSRQPMAAQQGAGFASDDSHQAHYHLSLRKYGVGRGTGALVDRRAHVADAVLQQEGHQVSAPHRLLL